MNSSRVQLIVLGASAGAVDVLGVILPRLPRGLPVPIAAVIHLPASRPSMLAELFAHHCQIAIKEAEDKERLAPGCLYFAPPDYHLLVERNLSASLDCDEPVHFSRPAIDVLFESAARARGRHVLGVLLTGASRDGASGLAAIGAAGGITVVQDPNSAAARVMPEAGIASARPDYVLDPPGIAELIARISPTLP